MSPWPVLAAAHGAALLAWACIAVHTRMQRKRRAARRPTATINPPASKEPT